jgi:hypothetical protein
MKTKQMENEKLIGGGKKTGDVDRRTPPEQGRLRTLFRGLREGVQKELACHDGNLTLDALIVIAIHLDNLRELWNSHYFSPSFMDQTLAYCYF